MHERKLETKLAQIGNHSDPATGAVNPPIYLSTAYQHQGLGMSTGYDYSRTGNPTRRQLEKGFAEITGAVDAFACSSGMAAIQLVLALFKSGDEIVATEDLYGGTYRLLEHYETNFGVKTTYDDFSDLKQLEETLTEETKALIVETPTNPLMQVINISDVSALCQRHNLLLIVDNTFLTPYLQRPIEQGADIEIHSATKYIGGHNDCLAGLVAVKDKAVSDQLGELHNASGGVLSPFDSWLLMRGLKTLPLRMAQHQKNAQVIVEVLASEENVADVLYPGQGGMLSFRLKKSDWVDPFLQQLQLITFAESLGGIESFITYPATQTHADMPVEERTKRGVDDRLLRFSIGIEQADDLVLDLKQALAVLNH